MQHPPLPGARIRASLIGLALFSAIHFSSEAAPAGGGLDERYRFPFSLGAGYQTLTPLGSGRSGFDFVDLSGVFRLPLGALPTLQPTARIGITQAAAADGDAWTHTDYYALLGAAWSRHFSKTLEAGAELAAGASLSIFPDLIGELGSVANPNFLVQAGMTVGLSPAYNFALELNPTLRYQASLGPLTDFDGLSLGIGLTVHVRLGEDPDSAQALLRSIRFSEIEAPMVFPAMQSWYVKNPFAQLTIANGENFPVEDVQVAFFQKGYMDAPSVCAEIPLLKPGETREIGLTASFNREVFRTEGTTPVTGEITVSYRGRGRTGEQKQSLPYDLQDKSAIVWDDDRKAAAFITPSDSALRNYASYIRQICKGTEAPGLSPAVQFACQLYYALGELGILYQSDPVTPFAGGADGKRVVDSVSLPRDTLKRITGDCDDLTVLFASMVESAGYESGFVTVPGHIYAVVNTKVPAGKYADVHPNRDMTINLNGQLWIPVEITMIGRESFADAWRKGIEEWREAEADPRSRGFYPTASAQALYRPVGLTETDLGLQYGKTENIVAASARETRKLTDQIVDAYAASAKSGTTEELNRLGIQLARFGYTEKAISTLKKSASLDAGNLNPRINLGNTYFLAKDFGKALTEFTFAEKSLARKADDDAGASRKLAGVRMNIARCMRSMGQEDQASDWARKAGGGNAAPEQQERRVAAATPASNGEAEAKADAVVESLFFAE